jgi:hypothetical protein
MAIIIMFTQKQALSYDEIVLDKLNACYEAVKYFQNKLFTSHTAELWYDAPSEALGGIPQGEIPAQNPYDALQILRGRLKNLISQDLRRVVVIFRGVWNIKDAELAGYFSLHIPDDWRKVYGDLEISAYPQGDIGDIVDALWLMEDVTEIVGDFVKTFNRGISTLRIALSQMAFCEGIWNKYDPEGIKAIYITSERRGLLRLFYEARRKEKAWDMEAFAKPLDTNFLLDTLEETDLVQERINRELEQDAALEIPVGSKLYIGKELDSFKKLYRDVTESIIKPALSKLPKDTSVKTQIVEGLRDYPES